MDLMMCPNCKTTVVPKKSGECPACRATPKWSQPLGNEAAKGNVSRLSPGTSCSDREPHKSSAEVALWHAFFTDRAIPLGFFILTLLTSIVGCAGYEEMRWWAIDPFWPSLVSLPVVFLIYWFLPLVPLTGIVLGGDNPKTQGWIANVAVGVMAVSSFPVFMVVQNFANRYGTSWIQSWGPWAENFSLAFHGMVVLAFYGFVVVRPLVNCFRK